MSRIASRSLENGESLPAGDLVSVPHAVTGHSRAPLVAHVIYALKVGGMENGLVNLINRGSRDRFRHAIVCLTGYDGFADRIVRDDVPVLSLRKREGKDPLLYLRLWRALRELRPDIVHTRNLAALEAQLPAFLAGIRSRVHGEHGRDMHDLDGTSRKYRWLRKVFRPLIDQFIPLSVDLETYLHDRVGVPKERLTRICNGVDTELFHPTAGGRERLTEAGFDSDAVVIGSIGRMETVKDPLNLVRAFLLLLEQQPKRRRYLRLVMIGGGSLHEHAKAMLSEAGADQLAWLPGPRPDIPHILRGIDVFVLPSLAEGISNTLLEAMASGLPVVATRVGGNSELAEDGRTARLVPRGNTNALADAIAGYIDAPDLRQRHGQAGRVRAETRFSVERMVEQYLEVYDRVLKSKARH